VEKSQLGFPWCGKKFSTVWKKQADFSMPWKIFSGFFHAMEKVFPHRGKLRFERMRR
jgi:hypothetical protein